MKEKSIKFGIGLVAAVALLLVGCPCKIVGPTERGVVKTFGEVSDKILEPGLRWKIPVAQAIVKYDLTPTTVKVNIPVGEDGALSRDRQTIGIKGSFNWKYIDTDIVNIARRYSSNAMLIQQTNDIINTAIRNTVGKYDIANIVQDQVAISNESRTLAASLLSQARIPVEITALNLNNWDWSDDYDKMIRETVAMQQATLRAGAELQKIEQEAQQNVRRAEANAEAAFAEAEGRRRAAEADAQAAIAKAAGEAESKRIEGQGIADYNARISQNLSVQVRMRELDIELERAKRWDGRQIPTYLPLNPAGGIVTLPSR